MKGWGIFWGYEGICYLDYRDRFMGVKTDQISCFKYMSFIAYQLYPSKAENQSSVTNVIAKSLLSV